LRSLRTLSFFLIFLSCQSAWADIINKENFIFKPDYPACFPKAIAPAVILPSQDANTQAEAHELLQKEENTVQLIGDVVLNAPRIIIKADTIKVNNQQKTAEALDNVVFYSDDFTVLGDYAHLNDLKSTATIKRPTFQLTKNNSHGTGEEFTTDRKTLLSSLTNASFSTCKIKDLHKDIDNHQLQKNQVDWLLKVDFLEFDEAKETVYGEGVVLYFKSIPILYTPYLWFSTADRKTGLLFPVTGGTKSVTQKNSETYFSLPIYFNIAPEIDDTLTLTKIQTRGLLLENELRYLQDKHQATLTTHYIDDAITGAGSNPNNLDLSPIKHRWGVLLNAQQNWNTELSSEINWREVSDPYFYADLPINRPLQTKSYVSRNATISYQKANLNAHITVLDFLQLQNNHDYNYTKKPEVGLEFSHYFKQKTLQNFRFNLFSEATEFEISESDHSKPEALRTVISPSLQYNITKPYGHFKTELIANSIHYKMQDNNFNNTGAKTHSINVPQVAINGGLIFTRLFNLSGNALSQTLEPQIQYLYAPYQKQSDITLFDSHENSLDFSNLFAYNRFSGYDRIADANQISVALSSKILSEQGKTLVEMGIGQIFFLADQKVQLTGETISTETVSDYYLKIGFNTQPFSLNSTAQFSQHNYELKHANTRLKVEIAPNFTFLLADTVQNNNQADELEEISTGFHWRLNNNWTLGSYLDYDFTANRREELSGAIRYDRCCWATELSVKETKLENGLYNYSFQLQIELKGLSTSGTSFQKYLTKQLNF